MSSKQTKRHPNELELPDVHDEAEAQEILRVWTTDEDVLWRYKTVAVPVPAWGDVLAKVARSLAKSYAENTGGKEGDILNCLKQNFDEELAVSKEPGATGAVN